MFRVENHPKNEQYVTLFVELPEGQNQSTLVCDARQEIEELNKTGVFYGKEVHINGRITTGMSLMLGHALAHTCCAVHVFDPKLNGYVLCVWH